MAAEIRARQAVALEERRRAVSVPSDAEECLAYHRTERRCLVTVGEFNQRLAEDGRWVEGGGDSVLQSARILDIRKGLLAALLEERYADALVDGRDEAGIRAEEAWRAHLSGLAASIGEDRLRTLYRRHAEAFGPRREVQAEFLGASDSAFLDSLVHCMLAGPRTGGARKMEPAGKECASERLYLWGKLRDGDLPGILPRVTARLRQGEISGIVRGRFGWFVVAAARVAEVPAKTYEESRPLLAYMARLPDTGPEAPAEAGAATNKPAAMTGRAAPDAEPARPGDPMLRVWLMPRAGAGKGGKRSAPAWSDTGSVDAIRLRLSDLPAEMGCEAAALLRRSGRGISDSRFGTWYFQAAESLAFTRFEKDEPCGREAGKVRDGRDRYSRAAEYSASKEKDFKRNILESGPGDSGATDSGTGGGMAPEAAWIAENVTLADNVLKRF